MIVPVKRIQKRKDHEALLVEAPMKANHMETAPNQEGIYRLFFLLVENISFFFQIWLQLLKAML